MSELWMNPLEAILRHCAAAAPSPWYPSVFAKETGIPRDNLDPPLDRLRMGGLIELTEWMEGKGQGYALTPLGEGVLNNPRQLARLADGQLPTRTAPVADYQEEMHIPGDTVRAAFVSDSGTPVTRLLIYLNLAVFGVGFLIASRDGVGNAFLWQSTQKVLRLTGALSGEDVFVHQQWWRLLTCCFVHIGGLHLFVNMLSLYFIGPAVERLLGSGRYLLLYLLAGVVGSCGMLIENPIGGGAGASGAIWGLMTALLVLVIAHRRSLPPMVYQHIKGQLINVLILNVFLTFSVQNISKGAHFGGGIAGALLAVPIDSLRLGRGLQRISALLVVMAIPATAIALVWRTANDSPRLETLLADGEQRQFNRKFVRDVESAFSVASGTFNKVNRSLLIQNVQRRDPQEVEQVLKEIEARDEILSSTKRALQEHQPYRAPAVEKQRQTAIELLEATSHLLKMTADCLRPGANCTAHDDNGRNEQVELVNELQERWGRSPWSQGW